MDQDLQFKLQAWMDGELPNREAREIQAYVADHPDAQDLVSELSSTQLAFKEFGKSITLPESRDFYWSKIQRQISREAIPQRAQAPSVNWLTALRRVVVPMGSVAALVIIGILATIQYSAIQHGEPEFDSAVGDTGAFTYRDFSSGTTLVWLSYPAENEIAANRSADTMR